jgi:TolA-binding protein
MKMPAQAAPPASQAEVLAKVRRAAEQKGAAPAQVPVVKQRPPQGARLGELGRRDAEARALFERAKRDLDTRQYASALVAFQEFLRKYPRHPLAGEATYRLADAFFYLHEKEILRHYNQAMENYQRAIDLYPDSDQVPWALLMMGRIAMLAEEPFKALGYFQIVIEDYPKSEYVPLAMVYRGQAFIAEGKWTAALNQFRTVAERYPDSRFRKDADWGQAQALFGLARYERAALLLKDMDRRWPKLRIEEPELLYYIGEAEFQLKRYKEARRYFLWALNIMPDIRDNDIILTRVGDTYKFEGALAAARFIYKQVVNMFPDSDGGLVARIRLAESPQKDVQHPWDIFQVKATLDAYKTYREIIEKFPDRPVAELAQLKLGVYYYKKKLYTRALATLERLLQTHPRTPFKPEVRYTLDLAVKGLLHQLKRQNKPLALMDAYLRNRSLLRRPNGNEVVALLAWAYEKTGLDARAAKLYQVLLGRGEEKPAYIIGLARNLMTGRKYAQIVEELTPQRLGLLKGAEAVEARSILGRALAHLGRCDQALKLLAPLVKMDPSPPHAARDFLWLGRCLIKQGEVAEGLAALDRAVAGMGEKDAVLKYVVTMEAAGVARQAGRYQQAADYYQRAETLALDKEQRAQAIYQLAQTLRRLKRHALVATAFQRLAKMKVAPWSDMAQRHLADMALAPRLAGVGGFGTTPP